MIELYNNILFSYHGLRVYFLLNNICKKHKNMQLVCFLRKLLLIHSQILHDLGDLEILFSLLYA